MCINGGAVLPLGFVSKNLIGALIIDENILLCKTRPPLIKIQNMRNILTNDSTMAAHVSPANMPIRCCKSSVQVPVAMVALIAVRFCEEHDALRRKKLMQLLGV